MGTNGATPVITTFKNFDSGRAIVFQVDWPNGANQTNTPAPSDDSIVHFPTFSIPSNGSNQSNVLPSVLSWHGSFVQSIHGFSTGTRGGPTLFYNYSDPFLSTVIVSSHFGGNPKSATAGSGTDWQGHTAYAPGLSGKITELPKGFRHSHLLYMGSRGGITDTLAEWGKVIQQQQQQSKPNQATEQRVHKLEDITLTKIGYQTDNGAMYCFCNDMNCSDTLINEVSSLKDQGIPMGYLSFQGAGVSSGRGTAAPWCISKWSADGGSDPNHYPMDLQSFQQAIGIPLQLYAPYFCPNTDYFDTSKGSHWRL